MWLYTLTSTCWVGRGVIRSWLHFHLSATALLNRSDAIKIVFSLLMSPSLVWWIGSTAIRKKVARVPQGRVFNSFFVMLGLASPHSGLFSIWSCCMCFFFHIQMLSWAQLAQFYGELSPYCPNLVVPAEFSCARNPFVHLHFGSPYLCSHTSF